jgi:hypothetical protein
MLGIFLPIIPAGRHSIVLFRNEGLQDNQRASFGH